MNSEREVALHHTLQAGQVPDPHVPQCKDEEPAQSCNEYAIGPLCHLNTVCSTLNGTPSSFTMMVEQAFVRRTVPQDDEDPPQWHWFMKQWSVTMFSSSDIEALFNSIAVGQRASTSTSPISKCFPLDHTPREQAISSARSALEFLEQLV
jgi:hypothetical protein